MKVLVTGIRGQDGWYLAQQMLAAGNTVVGTTHEAGPPDLDVGGQRVPLVQLDLADVTQIDRVIATVQPDAVFNYAARASSAQLFDDPLGTAAINGVAVAGLLEAIRRHDPRIRFCQASSSEIFAGTQVSPQDETTAVVPLNAYGAAKAFADHLVAAYRQTHGLFACSAVLYPHESPRRPVHFLVRKVARAAARIRAGVETSVTLGDLDAVRDWGYAPDYVDAMRRMLQAPEPRDYVLGSGQGHTVRQVCEIAFGHVGLDWQAHVAVDQDLKRAPERAPRIGNAARARRELGWQPTVSFSQLIAMLVDLERSAVSKDDASGKEPHGPSD
jgi:GDPmannose 4,6-dehydratase